MGNVTMYKTEFFGDTYTVTGNFAEPSSPVFFDYVNAGQVADYRHIPRAAMRAYLEGVIEDGGKSPTDFQDEIDAAIENMVW